MRTGMRGLMAAVIVMALTTSGCIMIHSSSISDSAKSGPGVTTTASDIGILHLSVPANLTQTANQGLVGQCPGGKVTDVQTELSMRDFIIVQMYQVTAAAVCQ